MASRGGAGDSVSAGANVQARVAAYLFVASLGKVETLVGPPDAVASFSFETFEEIDDFNVRLVETAPVYV